MRIYKGFTAVALLSALIGSTAANAAVTISISQNGANIVSKTTGTFDTALAKKLQGGGSDSAQLEPDIGLNLTGDSYAGLNFYALSGPATFGTGSQYFYDFSSGTPVGLIASAEVFLISDTYVSNSEIFSTGIINNATLAGLGLATGVYQYAVGGNAVTLSIGEAVSTAVPEPATWAMMMSGLGLAGAALRRRRTTDRAGKARKPVTA